MKKEVIGLLAVLIIIPSIIFAVLVLDGTTSYSSTDTNVTQEVGFAHLNISDGNLVFYMPFDYNHSSGIVYDYSNNSNDGNMTNFDSNYTVDGKYGGAYSFDGIDDYINTSFVLNYTNVSISFWIKSTHSSSSHIIDGRDGSGDGYRVYYTTGSLSFYVNSDASTVLVHSVGDGEWHHVFLTYNGTDTAAYFDGINEDSESISETISVTTNMIIGAKSFVSPAIYLNGSLDELMIFNRSLNSTEITAIYNNQSARFMNPGTMLFVEKNLSVNDTTNITLADCSTLKGSSLQAKINDGDYQNFSSCNLTNYFVRGNLTHSNLTIKLNTDSNNFYSPLIIGNITLDSFDSAPSVNITAPNSSYTYTSSSVLINVTTNQNSTCNYSINSGTSNSSLTANATGTGHVGTKTALSNGNKVLNVYCADLQGNANNSVSVSFTVAVPTAATEETTTSSGTGSKTYTASSSSLEEGYSVKLTKNQKVELNLGNGGKVVEVKLITSKKVVLEIGGEEYSFPKNSTLKLDLDSDGTYDLEIKNNDIIGRFADMEFRIISEEVASDEQEEQQSNVSEAIKNIEWWVYVVIGVVIVLIVVGIVLKKKKR